MKRLALSFFLVASLGGSVLAQSELGGALRTGSATPSPTVKPAKVKAKDKSAAPSGPTIITAEQEATFDEKAHIAVFIGNVKVVSPQFTLTCKKLTAYLNQDNGETKPAASPAPSGKPNGGVDDNGPGGGLDHAFAEGDVVIIEQKPAENGGKPEIDIGKSATAKFNNKTGEMVLMGWPQLQQGINTHIATSESTVMTLHKDGHLKTVGPSRSVIQDQPDPSPSPAAAPSATSTPLGSFQ
jgi:lipopolysaccharide export system protein LptA